MNDNLIAVGEAYLKAWGNKDIQTVATFLHPEVHFTGPNADVTGKESALQGIQRMFGVLKSIDLRTKFANGNQLFLPTISCASSR